MPKSASQHGTIATATPVSRQGRTARLQKTPVLLLTRDAALWPQIGAELGAGLTLKQVDSTDELLATTPPGQAAVVLWDAREQADHAAVLSRLSLHSALFAVVALDDWSGAPAWTSFIQKKQVVAHVGLPINGDSLAAALADAREEVNARRALLGEAGSPQPATPAGGRRISWMLAGSLIAALAACAAAWLFMRHPASSPPPRALPAASSTVDPPPDDEKLDLLLDRARQAMLERRFIEPAAGSALALYREALLVDPGSGEARQGLQRLAEILYARVQSALDERKFDVALQALETARSIDAADPRLAALDERIASLRAEWGPTQILAAINAQNFDRAVQLIDEAARAKSLSGTKLTQLREEVRRGREEFDQARLLKLAATRLQQDQLLDPHNDNAAFYLDQARVAGANPASLAPLVQDLAKRLTQLAHTAIEQHRFNDVDRIVADMRNVAAPPAAIAAVQRDAAAARSQPQRDKTDQPQYLELAQSRLAQGRLLEPDNDNAFFYIKQQLALDPKNGALPIAAAVQAQIIERAAAALTAGDAAQADALLQTAAQLGASPALDAAVARASRAKQSSAGLPLVGEESLTRLNKLEIRYPLTAQQSTIEGWVELGFTVTAAGTVSNINVLGASPARTFEAAATKAVARLQYQPVMQEGKPTAVLTKLRVVFRLAR